MGLYLLKYPYRKLLTPLSRALRPVHPDVLSYLATGVTIGMAFCYLYAAQRPVLLLAAIGLIVLRMTLNTLDGLLAIQRGQPSLKGEIVNALPDRYSDVLMVLGIALSPLCRPVWGMLALSSVLLVSYTGTLGKAVGVEWQHQGPMGKVERLISLMVFSLIQFLRLRSGSPGWEVLGWSVTPLECGLILFVALGQATVWRRTRGMLRQIARLEWQESPARRRLPRRALVAYDSNTGNTERVAGAIADCLQADLRKVEDARDPQGYDLVVIGSPTLNGKPSEAVMRFLRANPALRNCAAFVTYGAPLWGPISARRCLRAIAEALGSAAVATFACKGRHARFGTYKAHPDDNDLLSAFLFGIRVAKRTAPRERAGSDHGHSAHGRASPAADGRHHGEARAGRARRSETSRAP